MANDGLPSPGRVFLVGAGPGDPGLLTLRAVECLQQADLVLYDELANPQLLDHALPTAERLCVNQFPGPHPQRQPQVQARLVEAAREGKTVVRLKGGDPLVFGRGAEEAAVLRDAGVPFEIVPGVTAALAAAACAGIPLTHRDHASAVAFVTGHECPGKPGSALDWPALARFPGTLVLYMAHQRIGAILKSLADHGKPGDTPAAAVHAASTSRQVTVTGTLADLATRVAAAGFGSPTLLIVGPVVGLRPTLNWFERRPLAGTTVLVTRPPRQARAMVHQLETLGAAVLTWPVLDLGPAPDPAAVDRALDRLSEFQWLVFTSPNGVEAFLRRLVERGRDWRALGHLQLAAIGPGTAQALAAVHLRADLVPPAFRSESLAAALKPRVAGQRVLLARAAQGREVLREELTAVAEVEQVAVYRQLPPTPPPAEVLRELEAGAIHYVTLTSSNIVRGFLAGLTPAARAHLGRTVRLASISPVTTAAARELGLEIAVEATEYTPAGLVAAVAADALKRSPEVARR